MLLFAAPHLLLQHQPALDFAVLDIFIQFHFIHFRLILIFPKSPITKYFFKKKKKFFIILLYKVFYYFYFMCRFLAKLKFSQIFGLLFYLINIFGQFMLLTYSDNILKFSNLLFLDLYSINPFRLIGFFFLLLFEPFIFGFFFEPIFGFLL